MSFKPILGAAQFGSHYGITNKSKVKIKIVQKILKVAKEKISTIDTAINYKDSNKILNKLNNQSFKINSKIAVTEDIDANKNKILKHLKLLKINSLNVLFIHNVSDFLKMKKKKKILNELISLKKKNLFKKLGLSLYDPIEFKNFIKIGKPDILQVPFNILDRRFEKRELVQFYKKNKIVIQARSCFLQGLLNAKKTPDKFEEYIDIFDKWRKWCKKNKVSRTSACLIFIKNKKFISECVFGVTNENEFKQILKSMNSRKKYVFPNFEKMINKNLIDPRKW